MPKKSFFLGALTIIFLGIIGFYFYQQQLNDIISDEHFSFDDPTLEAVYHDALLAEEKIRKDPDDYEAYLEAGLAWKSLGDRTENKVFYQKAKEIYQKQIEAFPEYWVPWWNLATLQKKLGEYLEAEESFQKAIEVAPGEGMIYLALIDLYRYNLKGLEKELEPIYEEALRRVVQNTDIVVSYASYLYEKGEKEKALEYYEAVFEKNTQPQIKEEIERIKKELSE